jgi:uncharacterized membrane protein YcaP (DUF421 family)
LTIDDLTALLPENGADNLGEVGYLLYETRGSVTLIPADRQPGPLAQEGLDAAGLSRGPQSG